MSARNRFNLTRSSYCCALGQTFWLIYLKLIYSFFCFAFSIVRALSAMLVHLLTQRERNTFCGKICFARIFQMLIHNFVNK